MIPVYKVTPIPDLVILWILSVRSNDSCISSAWRQMGLTGYCFKFIDRPFCIQGDNLMLLTEYNVFSLKYLTVWFYPQAWNSLCVWIHMFVP